MICSPGAVCVLAPGESDACVDFGCADYAECSDSNVCTLGAALGEPCGYQDDYYGEFIPCAGALVCDGEVEFERKCVEPTFSEDVCEVPGMPFSSSDEG